VNARWVVCNPEDMLHFSTIGYFFGKQVNASTGFPVGADQQQLGWNTGRSMDTRRDHHP